MRRISRVAVTGISLLVVVACSAAAVVLFSTPGHVDLWSNDGDPGVRSGAAAAVLALVAGSTTLFLVTRSQWAKLKRRMALERGQWKEVRLTADRSRS